MFRAKPDNVVSMYTFHGGNGPGGGGDVTGGELSGRDQVLSPWEEVPGGESAWGNCPGVKCPVTNTVPSTLLKREY